MANPVVLCNLVKTATTTTVIVFAHQRCRLAFSFDRYLSVLAYTINSEETPHLTMSRLFLEEESERDLTKPKIRVKGHKDGTESGGNNLVVLDVTRQFVMTPVYLQSRLANMSCDTSIAGLNKKLMMKYPIESSRLSVVSSANKKEGFMMVKESILPMAELKNLTRNELIVYASQFNFCTCEICAWM